MTSTHHRFRRARLAFLLVLASVVAAACSVSEPRDGFTAARDATAATSPADNGSDQRGDGAAPPTNDASSTTSGPASRAADGSSSHGGDTGSTTPPTTTTGETSPGTASGREAGPTDPGSSSTTAPAEPRDSSAVGVTEDTITVSFIAGFGGAYGPVIEQTYAGFEVWLDDVNARGGIHGRQVQIRKVDHQETAAGGVAACKEVLQNGSFFAMIGEGQGDANVTAADCLDENQYVHTAFVGAPDPSWTHSYYMIPSSIIQGQSLASFVDNKMGDGDKKLGVLHLSAPVYSLGKDAYVKAARDRGMDVAAVEQIEPNQASFTPQLLRMRNAGVENLAIIATIEAVGILRDARALNYRPNFTGIVWLFDFITQAARGTADGAQGLRYSATVDSPAFQEFQDKARDQGRSGLIDGEALIFYGYGLLLEEILTAAGPEPSSETLRAGIESIRDYNNQILPPISWGPGDFMGAEASFPSECCNPDYTWSSMGPPRREF